MGFTFVCKVFNLTGINGLLYTNIKIKFNRNVGSKQVNRSTSSSPRLIISIGVFIFFLIGVLNIGNSSNGITNPNNILNKNESPNQLDLGLPSNVEFFDLNDYQGTTLGKENEEIVLMLIPLRNAEHVLPLMFKNIMNITYDHSLIDIAFLVSDCSNGDLTYERVSQYSDAMQEGQLIELFDKLDQEQKDILGTNDLHLKYLPNEYRERVKKAYSKPFHKEYSKSFRSIQIFKKDFGQVIGQGFSDRHEVKIQGIRRKLMGRARNWLTSVALKPYHSWVLWRDADIELVDGDFLETMMKWSTNYDVLIPNVWRPLPIFLGQEQPYDLNSWMESGEALALANTLDEDEVIVEGYPEYETWRVHLAYLRKNEGPLSASIQLDGVGGVSILSKAKVFRSGGFFPAFSFENHAETEGFGKLVKRMGMKIGGFQNYVLWHIFEPSEDDLIKIGEIERMKRRFKIGKQDK